MVRCVRGEKKAVIGTLYDEVHTFNGGDVASILWDEEKLYDPINISKLIKLAFDIEYPIKTLALGLTMHMAVRVLKGHGTYLECPLPSNRIIARDLQSNFLARVLLYAIMDRHYNSMPRMLFRTFVDDIRQSHAGKEIDVIAEATEVAESLAQDLIGVGCKISDKSVCLSNKKKITSTIKHNLKHKGTEMNVATVGKDLGVATTAGMRRTNKILAKRISINKGRVSRIKMLSRINKNAGKLFNTGAWPAASYGKEAMGMSPGSIRTAVSYTHLTLPTNREV